MKNIYLSSVKKLLVLLMIISSLGVTAQTSVTIQPDRIGCVGDTIHIPIHVTGTNVYNMAFYITYDHSVLSQAGLVNYVENWMPVFVYPVPFYNPSYNPTTLACFLDVAGSSGITLNNDKVIDLVFQVIGIGSTSLHLRTAPDPLPVSGIWDYLGGPILPVTYTDNIVTGTNFLPASVTIASNPVMPICPGSMVTFTATPVNGGINPAFQWKNMNIDIPGATNATYITNTLLRNDQITCVMTSSYPCATGSPATSNVITVTFPYADFVAGLAGIDQAICYNTIPDAIQADNPTGGIAPYSLQWESSTDGILWSPIFGETNNIYAPPALNQTTMYRQMQSYTGICGTETVYTNIVTIQVYPQFMAGSIAASQIRCYGAVPDQLIGIPPTGGKTPYTYQWQDSPDGITWSNISGATDLNFNPPALYQTTYYQMLQTSSGDCGTVATNMLTITIHNQLIAGDATPPQTKCYGATPSPLSIINTTGGSGLFTYQWQDSPDGVIWSDISGATANTYTFTAPLTTTTYYRAEITDTYCILNPLTIEYTNPVLITIYDQLVAGDATQPQTICYGGTPAPLSIINTTGGSGLFTYQWQDSPDGVVWSDIPGATDNTYTFPTPLTMTMHYQAEITDTYCGTNPLTVEVTNPVTIIVNPLPVPTITGPIAACVNSTGNIYTTEAGMTGYTWVVVGGTIVGPTTGNSINVTWTTVGAQSVSVNYTDGNGCTAAAPTVLAVTVNPLPVPTITGPATACNYSTGNVYTTEAGMTGYIWTVVGGTITAGSGTNAVTVTWNTVGSQSISVNYTNGNGCTAAAPTVKPVTIYALPAPTIAGLSVVCAGTTSVAYSTEPGMTGYVWTISSGGTITSGIGTNNVLVTWNTAGAQSISVNYTNANGCTALTPTVFNVTVNPLPTPTITGPNSVCVNSTGNVYTTETGMTNYSWTVSAGGTITSGSTSNAITVTWSTTGAKTVSVNYYNANNCTAANPTVYNVTVNPLPVPTITGLSTVCKGTTGVVYTTQTGMTNYIWTVSAGGTITAGGTPTSNSVTITWNTAGVQAVTVNYTNANGCTAASPVSYSVTVNPTPVPVIGSNNVPCVNSTGNNYYTETGMTGYVWTVSAGGTITSGQGTSSILVTWTVAGSQWVSVNYNNTYGCPAPTATVYNLFVNPLPNAAAAITGTANVCAGTNGVAYSTTPVMNATSYTWTLPAGATIATGAGTTNITVNFGPTAVSGNIIMTGTNSCGNGAPSTFAVVVNPLPANAGTITGPAAVCEGATSVGYTVPAIANATGYVWTVPAGATIISGGNTNSILVNFTTPGTGVITVKGTNACGSGVVSPNFSVTVNAIPPAPVITANGNVLTSSSPTGNQWYYEGNPIPGATGQTYTVLNNTGYYWCVVTINGCSSGISNKLWIEVVGIGEMPSDASFSVYPVPNDGVFNISIDYPIEDTFTIMIYNQIGSKIFEIKDVNTVGGKYNKRVDLRPISTGMYSVIFMNSEHKVVKKFIINR